MKFSISIKNDKMTEEIKFSIVIPVYNRPDEMKELLDSLSEQTFKDFELVVVEDGSSIKSEELCDTYRRSNTYIVFLQTKRRTQHWAQLRIGQSKREIISYFSIPIVFFLPIIWKLYTKS